MAGRLRLNPRPASLAIVEGLKRSVRTSFAQPIARPRREQDLFEGLFNTRSNPTLSHAADGTECGTESVVQSAILCKLRTFERPRICNY